MPRHDAGPADWELRLLETVAGHTGHRSVAVSRRMTRLGDNTVVWLAVLGAAAAGGLRERRWGAGLGPVATLALAAAGRRTLAELVGRGRPPLRLQRGRWNGPSFPSRHTTMAALGAFCTVSTLAPAAVGTRRLAAATVATGVGATRLVLGVHWPSDVAGAWLYVALVVSVRDSLSRKRAWASAMTRSASVRECQPPTWLDLPGSSIL